MPDADGDGISDASDNCPAVANTNQANADSDALGDVCDACPNDLNNDLDGDGICGDVDACPNDPNNDLDGDGVCGDVDNCPANANSGQYDGDADGIGNACESYTLYAGYYWYLSDYGQSCTQACAARGGVTDRHLNYTGYPNGNLTNCTNVATALAGTVIYGIFCSAYSPGCFIQNRAIYYDNYSPTTHDAIHPWGERVCSCAN